ncbi:hypothetical protein HY629_00060, partial [Candidatus Uhrbacteria bacterium]|nr:hypothetical protein [Candidatus Uhrbacteria bacterium]
RPQDLQKIGLSEKEGAVYLALLELGSDTVQNIGKKAQVNRATTYVILDALKKKGVVSTVEKGKKTYFAAESPEELLRIVRYEEAELKVRERELDELLPQLKAIFNLAQNKPVVRFYEGKDGLKAMNDEFLRSPGEEMLMIYSRDHVERAFSNQELDQVKAARVLKGKSVRSIYTYSKGVLPDMGQLTARIKIPEGKFPISCDIAICGDKVRIASLGKALSGIVIEDSEIAKTLRSIFELSWEAAQEYRKK